MEVQSQLKVAPASEVSVNYSKFTKVLILVNKINHKNETIKVGIWAPIAFVEMGNRIKTVKIVSAKALTNVVIDSNDEHSVLPDEVLISECLLAYEVVKTLVAKLAPEDNFYLELENLLIAYQEIQLEDRVKYQEVLEKLMTRATESRASHRKVSTKNKNLYPDPNKPKRDRDDYTKLDAKKIETLTANEINQEMRDTFKTAFGQLKFNLYTPLPIFTEEKAASFLHIVQMLERAIRNLGYAEEYDARAKAKAVKEVPTEPVGDETDSASRPDSPPRASQFPDVLQERLMAQLPATLQYMPMLPALPGAPLPAPSGNVYLPVLPTHPVPKALVQQPVLPAVPLPKAPTQQHVLPTVPKLPPQIAVAPTPSIEANLPVAELPICYNQTFCKLHGKKATLLSTAIEEILMSPDMCGFINYLDQISHPLRDYHIRKTLGYLIHEEIRDVTDHNKHIDFNMQYIIQASAIKELHNLSRWLDNASYYSDKIIDHLDLSCSYVTGSIIPACYGSTSYQYNDKYYIDTFYCNKYTVPDNYETYRKIMQPNKAGNLIRADGTKVENKILTIKQKGDKIEISDGEDVVVLTEEDGADIDIVVDVPYGDDPVAEDAEFQSVAQGHFAVVQKLFPTAQLRRVEKKDSYTLEIVGAPRVIQIYRCSLRNILTHHVGMVRGLITGNGADRNVYLSASCALSLLGNKSVNYYYFAGKNTPMEIILKYHQRGYDCAVSTNAQLMLSKYCKHNIKWNDGTNDSNSHQNKYSIVGTNYPSLTGYGNFNINTIHSEKLMQKYRNLGYGGNVNDFNAKEKEQLGKILSEYAYSQFFRSSPVIAPPTICTGLPPLSSALGSPR